MNGFAIAIEMIMEVVSYSAHPGVFLSGILLLAIVFLLSGSVKIRRPNQAAMAITDFGLVSRPSRSVGLAAGIGELVLGLALISIVIVPALANAVLAAAALVLFMFLLLIVTHLARGAEFACFCFGDSEDTLEIRTTVRTGLLAGVAAATFLSSQSTPQIWGLAEVLLALTCSAAVLGSVTMLGSIPDLWRWNRDPVDGGVGVPA
jgi:hypothetical protein